jgi:DNA-binding beta-propeller fold protein YncE
MRMKPRFASALLVALSAVALNSCTNNAITTPTTGFMWVTTQGDQLVASYQINLSTGGTSQVGHSVATGTGPIAIAITPAGDALFVVNRDDNSISSYTLNSDGSLAAGSSTSTLVVSPAGCTTGCAASLGQTPVSIAVDPSGKFLFVAAQGTLADPTVPGTISVFSVSGTTLAPVGPACPANYSQSICPVVVTTPGSTLGTGPSGVVASAVGNFIYVADQFTSTVSIFSYDSSGMLTENPTSPVAVGTNPTGLAFSRCAGTTVVSINCPTAAPPSYIYVANSGSNDISIFQACIQATATCASANGTLTQMGSTVGAGTRPASFMINPARDLVYAVDGGSFQISEYRYSSATGALTALSPATASTGASPLAGGITSDGNWAFVPNNGGSSVSAYSVGTAGQLNTAPAIILLGQPSAVLVR